MRISNFRGIKELALEPHPRLTLLFGKNASGKSSLLDAIAVGLSFLGPSLPRLEESDPKWHRFAPKDMRRTFLEDGTPVLEKQQEVQLRGDSRRASTHSRCTGKPATAFQAGGHRSLIAWAQVWKRTWLRSQKRYEPAITRS